TIDRSTLSSLWPPCCMSRATASKPCEARISTVNGSGTPDHAQQMVSPAASFAPSDINLSRLFRFSTRQTKRQRKNRPDGRLSCSRKAGSALYLLYGLREQFVHRAPDLVLGLVDPSGIEISLDLAQHVVVSGFLEIRCDNF